jgi:hypothetical protein
MPEFRKNCDVYQGFNFKKDKQSTVGFLTALKVNDQDLLVNLTAKDPTNPTTDLKAVAILDNAQWGTGVTDTIYLSGRIAVDNRQSLAVLLLNDLTKVEVEINFSVYEYDPLAKSYYLAFHSNGAPVKGILEKRGSDLSLEVSDDPSGEVQSPQNFAVQIGVKPAPQAQEIHLATSQTAKIVKSWGMTVG